MPARDIIDVRSPPPKKRGRRVHADADTVREIRDTWKNGRKPNGEGYAIADLRRLFRLSDAVLRNIIEGKGAYADGH